MRKLAFIGAQSPNAGAALIAGIYLLGGGVYIFASSAWLGSIAVDPHLHSTLEVAKGLTFILVTGLFLFFTVRRQFSRMQRSHRAAASMAHRIADAETRLSVSLVSAATAHEMKNIITVLQAAQASIRKPGGREGPRADQMLDDMERALERLRGLARELMQQGRTAPAPAEPVDLRSVLDEVARIARVLRRDQDFDISVRAESRPSVQANHQDLEHVFRNLLLNAFEAGASRVELDISEDAEQVRVRVADDGPGVPEDVRESVFEPFVSRKEQGTGLGLAVVRAILERHGARIWLEQRSGAGAEFVIEFPKARDQRASSESAAERRAG